MRTIIGNIGRGKIFALLNKATLTLNGLMTVFVIIRVIPESEFGILVLVNTFDLVAFAVSGGLILQALQKFGAEAHGNELSDLFVNSAFLYCLLSLIPAIAISIFSLAISNLLNAQSLADLLRLLPIIAISHWGRRLAYHVFLAKEMLLHVFLIDAVPFLISSILFLFLYFSGSLDSALIVIIVRLISDFIASIVGLVYLRNLFKIGLSINKSIIHKLLGFGKFSLGSTFGNLIQMRIDTLMISYFYNPLALAMYNSARGIAELYRNVVHAANMVVLPRASNLSARGNMNGVRTIYYKGILFSLFLIVPIATLLLTIPDFILYVAYGNKYLDSENILRVFAICSLISPLGTIGSSVSSGIGKPNYTFIAIIVSVLCNVCLNLILIPEFGAIGAAYATLAALASGGITITYLLHREIDLSIASVDKSSIVQSVFPLRKSDDE